MDYKDTLNLPQTDFPMKANLPRKEPSLLDEWEKAGLYALIEKKGENRDKYVLHDGPPYANGDIHIGHALNKILKDIIVKYKTMKGRHSPYVPGWDCHGLPVEHQLFRELGISKYGIDKAVFRKKAHAFAMKFVDIQREQFKRLGVFGDWENPYLTLTPGYEAAIIGSFGALVRKGYVYRGLKPVNWCIKCETALAEAEVEYENHTSPSVYVKFKLADASESRINENLEPGTETFLLIWTTTPWTLVANVAIAVHPELEYSIVGCGGENLIMASDRAGSIMEKISAGCGVKAKIKGKRLENIVCRHPFMDRTSRVVLADYVSSQEGTGCVHTAPGHGAEDYQTGLRYKLDVVMPVDAKGVFDNTAGEVSGMPVFKANKKIIETLESKRLLLSKDEIEHSYPHCWRCKEPVITRATKQWFINVDNDNLRKKTLDMIQKIRWIPPVGRGRIGSMVENRPDWCLSRQRYWGVPIPVFYCGACGYEVLDADVIARVRSLVEKEGSDVWFAKDAGELLPDGFACPGCKSKEFVKEEDIIDVWFDSGVSHQAVLKTREGLSFPCALYLEGSDQHRGWFQTSLLTAVGIEGASPFESVLTHGFVVDGEGRKMSKSLGNVISPQEIISEYGSDILRWWVASSNYNDDIRISDEILARIAESYRKIRNTIRYMLGNLCDYDPAKDAVGINSRLEIDRWAVSKTHSMLKKINLAYENFEFHKIYRILYDFCVTELSSFYLDILKDRLYTFGKKSLGRKSAQSSLYDMLLILEKVVAPVLVFTAEEAWRHTKIEEKAPSVHLADWPEVDGNLIDAELEARWDKLIEIRRCLLKAVEDKRSEGKIGSSLEAAVELAVTDENIYALLNRYKSELPEIFIVSEVRLSKVDKIPEACRRDESLSGLGVIAGKAEARKCARCWNYRSTVGSDKRHPGICERCIDVILHL